MDFLLQSFRCNWGFLQALWVNNRKTHSRDKGERQHFCGFYSHLKSVLHNWDFSTIIIIRTGVSNWNYFKFFICQLSRWMQNKTDCLTRLCWLSRYSIDWVNEKMEWWEKSSACVFQLLTWIPKRGGLWSRRSSSVMPLQRGDTSVMNTICFS